MQIVCLIIVIYAIYKTLKEYEPLHKRIAKYDAEPYNSVKSDKWKRDRRLL